jgi:hypothetical protein
MQIWSGSPIEKTKCAEKLTLHRAAHAVAVGQAQPVQQVGDLTLVPRIDSKAYRKHLFRRICFALQRRLFPVRLLQKGMTPLPDWHQVEFAHLMGDWPRTMSVKVLPPRLEPSLAHMHAYKLYMLVIRQTSA